MLFLKEELLRAGYLLSYQKERLEEKEISAGTLHHYVKTLKTFVKEQTLVSHRRKLHEVFQNEEDTQMTERLH